MSRVCSICGKGKMSGNNVSHSHLKTKKVSSSGFTVENTKSTTNYTAEEIINKMKR